MISRFRIFTIKFLYVVIDITLISLAIYIAARIRPTTLPFEITYQNLFFDAVNPFRSIFVLWVTTTVLYLYSKSLYETRREISKGVEFARIIKCIFLSSLIVIVAIYALKIQGFPRTVLMIGAGLNLVFLTTWRVIKRLYVGYLVARGYNNFNTLIIGAGKVGIALAEELRKSPELGINVCGFLDDFKTDEDISSPYKVLGNVSEFKKYAKKEFVNKIFITMHHDNDMFVNLLKEAKELGVAVQVIPQGYELMTGECKKYNIGIIPVLEYCDVIPLKVQVGKRLLDVVLGSIGLVFLVPFFILFAIIIFVDNPGQIFYVSQRYGRNGRKFNMLKFRSMHTDADRRLKELKEKNEVDGPIFKMKNDPRITRFGKILRKFSLDELPQVINVVKGEMSLVGPRPLPIEQIEKEDLEQLKRLEVRPGMTGLWQIKGRSDISFRRMLQWDIWYINNWSFWLDLNILFQTVPVVIKGKGAY